MPILFLSDSGLHGDLLFSLISESIPMEWERAEFGKQKHCLNYYEAVVVDCLSLTSKSAPSAEFIYIKNMIHPRVVLINFSTDLPSNLSRPLEERKFLFLCDNRSSQKDLLGKLEFTLQNTKNNSEANGKGRLLLTKREQEILTQLTTGDPNSIIASRLHLSEHTVKNHMYNIFRKIGVKNRLQASNWAKLHLQAERI
ncbi:response regulator transcription factor [Microbulbifer sp. SA54]|uniref:response regulator transcription factor n=1 Tax=Microbulbifer sp. SA54 TaxID=3401577 RepID=UPI003AACB2F6